MNSGRGELRAFSPALYRFTDLVWHSLFKNAKGGVSIHAIIGAPGLISLSDANIVNRIIAQFLQRSLAGK